MSDVAFMERADTPKENRSGRMERLGSIIVGRVLPGIRRHHEEFSAPASSESSARGERVGPAGDEGAAAGTYTPTAAGERVNLGEEEGTVARQYRMQTAASPPRTAETAKGPMPPRAVSAVHFAPPSSTATTASNFDRQSASCS